jgi:hypothetical protein
LLGKRETKIIDGRRGEERKGERGVRREKGGERSEKREEKRRREERRGERRGESSVLESKSLLSYCKNRHHRLSQQSKHLQSGQ